MVKSVLSVVMHSENSFGCTADLNKSSSHCMEGYQLKLGKMHKDKRRLMSVNHSWFFI